jgi:hypothetical protein
LARFLQLHVLVSAALTTGGYFGATGAVGWPHRTSLATAAGGSLAAGPLKELFGPLEDWKSVYRI